MLTEEFVKLAQSQVGYKETGNNHNKYAQYFDTPKSKNGPYQWFNGKKQNVPWCAIFVCWLFVMILEPDNILGSPDKVRSWLKFPKPADNCAAGCPYLWSYLKSRFGSVAKTKGQAGDVIFFNAKCTHVGIIEKVENGKYHTIEGNKNNAVSRCTYSVNSTSIYGIIRPDYSSIEPKEAEPTPEPLPVPEPVKPTPVYPKYKVKTVTGEWLALRVAPNTKAVLIVRMNYGAEVDLVRTVPGEKVYGSNEWAYVNYTKNGRTYTGYCIKSRLKKI